MWDKLVRFGGLSILAAGYLTSVSDLERPNGISASYMPKQFVE